MYDRLLYCSPFFLSATLILIVALFAFGRVRVRGGWYLALSCLAATVWAASEGTLYFGLGKEANMLITRLQYFGITALPPLALLFGLSHFGFESWVNKWTHSILFLIAAAIVLLVWTNPWHHLVFTDYYTIHTGPFPMLGLKHGPFWWGILSYHYALIVVLTIVLVHQILTASGYHSSQAGMILVAVAFVWLSNIVYVSGSSPVPNMDISPLAFVLVAGAMAWGFYRYKLLDILPMAKEKIFRSIDDLLLVTDEQDRILDINPAAESVFRIDAKKIIGQAVSTVFNQFPPIESVFGKMESSEIALILAGRERVYDCRASVIMDTNGLKVGKIVALRDITDRKKAERERKKLEAQFQRIEKMEVIGTLAGGVAHDLNNILSGLTGYPELLLMDLPEASALRKPILTIKKSGEKASAIVNDLLTLTRRGVAVTDVVNLNQIISDYLESPEHKKVLFYNPGIQIESNLHTALLNIIGSPVHLSKTVMNLVTNAAEAMPTGGKIHIRTDNMYIDTPITGYDHIESGDYVVLSVSDTGTGISPQDKERIFEPFYTKKVMGNSGTGLGMAVVWGTVKDHKGHIDVHSIEGSGTVFHLYFPVTREEPSEKKSRLPIENYMGAGESILVVDDVEEQREITGNMLKKLGYCVNTVRSGEEAVAYLEYNAVDLLVLDMIMAPGMDGLDTYRKIIELHPNQKAVIASGFTETERIRDVQRIGAGAYIKKPFTLETIGLAVQRELKD